MNWRSKTDFNFKWYDYLCRKSYENCKQFLQLINEFSKFEGLRSIYVYIYVIYIYKQYIYVCVYIYICIYIYIVFLYTNNKQL